MESTTQLHSVSNATTLAQLEKKASQQLPPLAEINRPNLTTKEASFYLNRSPQTLRGWACRSGTGPLKPRRIGGILAWSTAEVKALCGVQAGFAAPIYLFGLALLVLLIWATWPGVLSALDWAGLSMLGAGVIENFDDKLGEDLHPLPEREILGSLGDCLAQTARYEPLGYSKITAVIYDIDGPVLNLHLESATAAMFEALVTIFIRAGTTPEHVREILKQVARNLKPYDTLEPWTPKEPSSARPIDTLGPWLPKEFL
jgi:hypothetical protein